MKFVYIARDSSGAEVRGSVEAQDRVSAIAEIRAQGLLPTAIARIKSEEHDANTLSKRNMCKTLKCVLKSLAKAIDNFADKL